MPNYDYVCSNCKKRFELFLSFNEYGKKEVACPYCQSSEVHRKIGKVRFARAAEDHLEDFSDPDALDGLDEDPRSMGKMLRKMKSQVGQDAGPEFEEVVGRLESGETPEQIESEMPALGSGMPDPSNQSLPEDD